MLAEKQKHDLAHIREHDNARLVISATNASFETVRETCAIEALSITRLTNFDRLKNIVREDNIKDPR